LTYGAINTKIVTDEFKKMYYFSLVKLLKVVRKNSLIKSLANL